MPELTPSFVFEFERRMRVITETEYVRRLAAENIWWNKVARVIPMEGRTERVAWLLETATIDPVGVSGTGKISFENLVTQTVEYPSYRHGKGIKIQRDQLEDIDGTGLSEVAGWSSQIGNETAYYPQRLFAQLLLNGANLDSSANAYDGVPFFADNTARTLGGVSVNGHPFNPYRPSLGGYQNWCHGAASGSYPGALPIDDSVSSDIALQNLGKAIAFLANNKMPNGIDPRFLSPAFIIAPPRMAPRLRLLTDAKFIAQAASSGGGSADVQALINGWGLGQPVIAQELAAAFSYTYDAPFVQASTGNVLTLPETVAGSDTTYYIVCKQNMTSGLGGLLLMNRKPFKVTYYTGDNGGNGMNADLDRANELEWHVQGRMAGQYGQPFAVYRFDQT